MQAQLLNEKHYAAMVILENTPLDSGLDHNRNLGWSGTGLWSGRASVKKFDYNLGRKVI